MNIAIIEICIETHYSAVNGLIKTYCVDPNNKVTVYVMESIAKPLREGGLSDQVTIEVYDMKTSVQPLFAKIEKIPYDRMHICTVEHHFGEFSRFKPQAKRLIFHVHNIDIWFDSGLGNSLKNLMHTLGNSTNRLRETAKSIKNILVRNPARAAVLRNFKTFNTGYIVHSGGQKGYLAEFVPEKSITVFPFAINEGNSPAPAPKTGSGKIRVCIPGIVTDGRRDYTGLFTILDEILPTIKDTMEFDFLGFVEKSEPHLLEKILDFEKRGMKVYYHTEFVSGKKFDDSLMAADILLNNQKVVVSHTTKYGVSKESGMLFNMIRGCKPGIFPKAYAVDKEFDSALLYYETNDDLRQMLLSLANGQLSITKLNQAAYDVAQFYTPKSLYQKLVNA